MSAPDPARVAEMIAIEEAILEKLTEAYNCRALEYLHYSPAYDMTCCRLFALRLLAPCDSGSGSQSEDAPKSAAEGEAPQSGGEAASPKP